MATTVDRPQQKSPAQPRPAKPPKPLPRPPEGPFPSRVPEPNRRRDRALACLYLFGPGLALILGALGAILAALVIVLSGSGVEPPATGAAELVPGNALLYVHASTDTSRPAVRQSLTVSKRLPASARLFGTVSNRLDAILGGSTSSGVSFARDVRPWLGKEAALAVLDTPGRSAGSLIVLDVRSRAAATRFLTRIGAQPAGTYWGVRLLAEPSSTKLAFLRHYLVIGQMASVQSAIDVATGHVRSLAASAGYVRAASGAPAGRVIDFYASADGVRRALVPSSGLLGDLGALLDRPALSAASVSISPAAHGLRVDVHRTLVSRPAEAPASRPVQFQPTLAGVLPAGSSVLLDARGLHSSFPALLSMAARLGVAAKIGPLVTRLGSALIAQGADVSEVLRIFSGETVVAITPGRDGRGPSPVLVTRTTHPDHARAVLAGLEGPLTQVFAPPPGAPGQVPTTRDASVAGVPVRELSLAPGFQLVYAVAHGLVVLSSSPAGVAGVLAHAHALSDAPAFRSTLGDHPSEVTSLVFFDLSQLLRLGGQTGMIDSTREATLWPALETIRKVGLTSWRGANDTTTQLQLQIP
jgi:hypothetical protein